MKTDYGAIYNELYIEGDNQYFTIVNDGKVLLLSKVAIVLVLDGFVDWLAKNQDLVEAITIAPILPMEDVDNYKKELTDLIRYIIFDDQTCVHNLAILANTGDYYAASSEVIHQTSTLISKDNTMFPIAEDCLFNRGIDSFSGTVSISSEKYLWIETTAEPCEEYRYEDQYVIERYNQYLISFNVKEFFSKFAGGMAISINKNVSDVRVAYNQLISSEDKKVNENG